MANEAVYKFGTQKTLEGNGAATTNGVFTQADDANMTASDHNDYTLLDFVASFTLGTTQASAGEVVNLYAQLLDIEGTSDSTVPSANYRATYLGSFLLSTSASAQYIALNNVPIPGRTFACYIENACAAGDIDAGWTLKVTPKTIGPY